MNRRRWFLALASSAGLAAAVVIAVARPTMPDRRPSDVDVPSEDVARTVLAQTYERATQTTDARSFCASSEVPPTCVNQYQEVGGRLAVPSTPPQVVEVWVTGPTRVLTVCGVDGLGKTYRADFPVEPSTSSGSPVAFLDVFWNSKTYSGNKAPGEPVIASLRPQKFSC